MSNLNWFYSQRWAQKKWEKLLETRTVKIVWKTNGEEVELPKVVKLPNDLDLTNEAISNYLSNEYGWLVLEWGVAE